MEIVLDARRFKGRTRAHAYLKEALRLPDYYGKNSAGSDSEKGIPG